MGKSSRRQAMGCRLSNDTADVLVSTNVGPRIVRYGFAGEENMLAELPDAKVATELGTWKPWGGHRLWTAPEAMPRSYVPDNSPVDFEQIGDRSIRVVQPVEEATGVQKAMLVTLDARGTGLTVVHTITNRNLWRIELAVWALTIMNGTGGGTVILPQEPYRPHDEYRRNTRSGGSCSRTSRSGIRRRQSRRRSSRL